VDAFYHGAGCPKCRRTGYSGRVGIHELLTPSEQMRDSISSIQSISELRKLASGSGLRTLYEDGMAKVKAGITTVEEVLRATAG
jgi:type II secretory ATPase GspE/PulE/Tfp pilus assembly ATPase PilB-like protein